MERTFTSCAALCASLFAATAFASAQPVWLTVGDNLDNQLGGATFRDGDVMRYDIGADSASVEFNEDLFGGLSVDITAFHILPSGNYLLSVLFNGRTLGGLTFDDGDLVEYNPFTDTATFAGITESTFDAGGSNPDIYGISVLNDGAYALSTSFDQSINGVPFTDGDIVRYDPVLDVASVLVSEASIFDDGDGDIDALHANADGSFLISTTVDEMIGGVTYLDGDIVRFDPLTGSSSLFLSYDAVSATGGDVNGVYVPAPGGAALALAGLGFMARRRRS